MDKTKAFAFLLVCSSATAIGGVARPAKSYRLHSKDKSYLAMLTPDRAEAGQRSSPDGNYHLSVLKVIDSETKKYRSFWESAFVHVGAMAGKLSDDGEMFVVVSKFFDAENPVLWIYQKGIPVQSIYASDLRIDRTKLKPAAGERQAWLSSEPEAIEIDAGDNAGETRIAIKATDALIYYVLVRADSLGFFRTAGQM